MFTDVSGLLEGVHWLPWVEVVGDRVVNYQLTRADLERFFFSIAPGGRDPILGRSDEIDFNPAYSHLKQSLQPIVEEQNQLRLQRGGRFVEDDELVEGSIAAAGALITNGGTKALGRRLVNAIKTRINQIGKPQFKLGSHSSESYLMKKGWSVERVREAINQPARTEKTFDSRHRPEGGRVPNEPATAYYHRDGGWVVRNDLSGEIVGASKVGSTSYPGPWE